MKFECTECGHVSDNSGILEELERNAVEMVRDYCPECEEDTEHEPGVTEL